MTNAELKSIVESGSMEFPMVWQIKDSSSMFIVWQYLHSYGRPIKIIESYKDIPDTGFIVDDTIYVAIEPAAIIENCICIYKKPPENTEYATIEKLKDWQFVDYLQGMFPGIEKGNLEWIVNQYTTKNHGEESINFYRLAANIAKLEVFSGYEQNAMFEELVDSGELDKVSNLTIFDLSNAIMRRDVNAIREVLKVRDCIDLKPDLWLLSILLTSFRNIISIQIGNRKPDSMSDKQFYYVKKNQTGIYTDAQLINIYEMLTKIEYKFKYEGLDVNSIIDYIIINTQ